LIIQDLEISLFAFCEDRTNVVQIVGDHAQADPSLHSGVAPVDKRLRRDLLAARSAEAATRGTQI
jgi:hypothetical protein